VFFKSLEIFCEKLGVMRIVPFTNNTTDMTYAYFHHVYRFAHLVAILKRLIKLLCSSDAKHIDNGFVGNYTAGAL